MRSTRFIVAVIFLTACMQSQASIITGSGFFSVGFSPSSQGQQVLTGNYSFSFDEATLSPSAPTQRVVAQPLSSLNITTGPIGSTVFDLSNSALSLMYVSGVLSNIWIGGILDVNNSDPVATISGLDDWRVTLTPGGTSAAGAISDASISGIDINGNGVGSLVVSRQGSDPSPVPAPGTLLLLVFGILGMGYRGSRMLRK